MHSSGQANGKESEPEGNKSAPGGQKELEAEVIGPGLCTGCGGCVNLCPYQAIYRDKTVTLHPCDLPRGRCYAFCPRTPADLGALREKIAPGTEWTSELGPVRGFFIARAADERLRRHGQHGGTVSALMTLALREGLIDAAVLAEEGEGLLPRAVTIEDPEAVGRSGKSRFVVSPTLAEFNRIARTERRRIGVVATPCQALALAKRRAQPLPAIEDGGEKLQLVVGLFCGWALAWRALSDLLAKKTDPTTITGMDIPPSRYHTLEVYTPTGTVQVSLDAVTPCVRESCRSCDDMTAEYSDLSVGSARLPEGWAEARGWNQIIVRTRRGQDLLELARRTGALEWREVPAGNLEKLQTASAGKKKAAAASRAETGAADGPKRAC
ncbi:MAG: Coenzyme F420 hydrogenase/dehydrogenase, beta subunit C-terminal domain [Deltaproteobacteria bacterium]|nr:Coenzyme F420 hydrogenase/dehydrogenase, beta subunit C-terminal domain [Deltaproteobacteria bacterium]